MSVSPLAGKPAPKSLLVDVPKLVAAYFDRHPDPSVKGQRVAFGTSGHRDLRDQSLTVTVDPIRFSFS